MEVPVRIYGPVISTYTRIVEIVCEEAGLAHEVVPTPAHSPQNRHPFGKVPVVEIDGYELYESVSVANYIDNVHNGGALQPADPFEKAVSDRWIAVGNAYLFPFFERNLVMPYIMHRFAGQPLDRERIERALPDVAKTLGFLDLEIGKDGAWTSGAFSLADIFLYVILLGVRSTPEGAAGVAECANLSAWMAVCDSRSSIVATRWESETS